MTSTARRLVAAAAELLDSGGEAAVTLRAVGAATGVSHNAPYKHFTGRDELLAAVGAADFRAITQECRRLRSSVEEPRSCLLAALDVVIGFSQEHPARYRLLFNSPATVAVGGALAEAAEEALEEFVGIVEACQAAGDLPAAPSRELAVLVFATTHGLIDADASGRLRPKIGWAGVDTGVRLLVDLLARNPPGPAPAPPDRRR